jgi:predicted esterase
MFRLLFLIAPLVSLSACVTTKHDFIPLESAIVTEDNQFQIKNPKDKIIILYTSGARRNAQTEQCWNLAAAPDTILDLAGHKIDGKEIVFHGYCTPAHGNEGKENPVSKAEARMPDVSKVIKSYLSQGVPSNQIFVSGHSMGGWTSILIGAQLSEKISGTIAFAPSNGTSVAGKRQYAHQKFIERQTTALTGVSQLDALIFAFDGDRYNSPQDLAHLKNIHGVEFYVRKACGMRSPHMTYREDCFKEANQDIILDYIQRRYKAKLT